ncbi:MAG: hypothetical protein Q4D60_06070 [Eubacteriales bacterium]|nr:hypothetical protein [Eubacteriales bacterium]
MCQLIRAELHHLFHTKIFIVTSAGLLLYNIWDILLTDFGFNVGWSFFLFQKTPWILISVAMITALHISRELGGKIIYHKIIFGYQPKTIYQAYILAGIIETSCLLFIDTSSILLFSYAKNFTMDIHLLPMVINLIIVIISATVISVFITVLVVAIPNRILSLFIVIGISCVLFQKGADLSVNLSEPTETIFYNETEKDAPMENPLYIKGTQRDLYCLELIASPYAQVQYEKFILFEGKEQKSSTSLLLKKIPYHLEFIFVGMIELLFLYYMGRHIFLSHFK